MVFEDTSLSYAELNRKANQLAHHLRQLGVRADDRVAICVERSLEMMVGLLAILKAGGAYVPLDPAYPAERLRFMLEDSQPVALLTQKHLISEFSALNAALPVVDLADAALWQHTPEHNPDPNSIGLTPNHLAYVIYTSGSTGQPKGVMVEHRNITNFFGGMNQKIICTVNDTLLAVTAISFDISVLELLWTLTCGATVLLFSPPRHSSSPQSHPQSLDEPDYSLFYFSSEDQLCQKNKYRLLLEGAGYADRNGLTAVWTPERHFHKFGGLYPNPAVTGAAVAAMTRRIQVRAGSVVLPLHNVIRVAEEWSAVDNLSQGRTGIAFASGWNVEDFSLAPDNYATRRETTFRAVDTFLKLWRGETLKVRNGIGEETELSLFPKPVQLTPQIWITAAGNSDTFAHAGKLGVNVLTHLLGQSIEDLSQKITLYRKARASEGHDPNGGKVTLMLHTFMGGQRDQVKNIIRRPFIEYLRSSADLTKTSVLNMSASHAKETINAREMNDLLSLAFDRYYEGSALFGTVSDCLPLIDRLKSIGVNEIACLIDFGIDEDEVLGSLNYISALMERMAQRHIVDSPGKSLGDVVARRSVTLVQCTPSVFQTLFSNEEAFQTFDSLRCLMLGGETLPLALVEGIKQRLSCQIFNMYGPTETTIWSLSNEVLKVHTPIAIGRPIANMRIYILDSEGEPVAVGVAGELYIAGVGVARGYLNRPDLTAERFLKDPFVVQGEARMYRTGDLGRWLPDGNIEFLGRNDFQVKLRGFRIELGEIEARLMEHSAVREAVVIAREDTPGDKRLVAYFISSSEHDALDAEQLRAHLAPLLPDYMVPAAYVPLDALPLTPNGKLDRKALPAPDQDAYATRGYEPPQGETEARLAAVWAEVLKLDRVGRHDNFFELGGHSLLAVRTVSRLRQGLGVEVAIRDLFAHPELADLARALQSAAQTELPAIAAVERSGHLPLSFAQQRLWFLSQMEGTSEAYHIPLSFRLRGDLQGAVLRRALDRILVRHEALRTTFALLEGEPIQRIAAAQDSRFRLIEHDLRLHDSAEQELARLAELEANTSFDLQAGPLIRGRLIRLADNEHALLITLHHIVSDGWSMGVLVDELSTLYGALLRGQDDPLPELEIQYADYALWQRQWIKGEILQQQAEYWKSALAGVPALLELPTDHPRPAQKDYAGAFAPLLLDEPLTADLKSLSRRHGTTLFMTLLAAWAALLARLSGQQDVLIGTPTANRGRAEIERLIGFFVNTLALRVDLSGSPTVSNLLEQVKARALAAQQHQDIPFEQVVELIQPLRSLSHTPLFQVMLAWQNPTDGPLQLPGLTLKPQPSPYRVAKFDLTLSLQETGTTVAGGIEYATSLFEQATIERYLGYFRHLLKAMVEDDTRIVDRLPILSASERRQVLYEWNDTSTEFPSDKCVHQLFQQQVTRTPEATAVVFEDTSLSYAELNRKANQLAHHLRQLGVRADDRVAICVERSLEMMVGLLAILKAGELTCPSIPPTRPNVFASCSKTPNPWPCSPKNT